MSDYFKEARKARNQGDYSKAGDLFFLGGDEKHAMDMYLKGGHYALAARLLAKKQDWKNAAKYYIQSGKFGDAAEIYAEKLRDYRTAAAMFEKNNDFLRASSMAERAGEIVRAALLADQAEMLQRAANLFVRARKYERAGDVYQRMLNQLLAEKDEKGFLQSHRSRIVRCGNTAGNIYARLKEYEKAAKCYEIAENFPKAAECFEQAKQFEEAAELYYRLQNPSKAYALLGQLGEKCARKELFADVCFQLGKYEEAAELYLQSNRILRAAESYEADGEYYRAALFYESLEDYATAADLFLKLNEPGRAAELYEKGKNYDYAAKFYGEAGKDQKAIECLILAGKKVEAAKLQIQRDQAQQAVTLLQQLGPEDEDYADACMLLAQLFEAMGMYSVAQQKLNVLIQQAPISPENIEFYYRLASLYDRSAQYSRARELFEKVCSVDLKYKDAYERLQKIKSSNLLDGAVADSAPGSLRRIIGGRYELVEKIGKDASGILYKAIDLSLQRSVMIRRFAAADKSITRELADQTRVLAGLNHSNIISIYDSGKDEDYYFVCMEYVDGMTLRKYLSRGALDISEICEFASQICLGLSYAHKKGVVHKNLSPENIYVAAGNLIKIANFGIEAKWERGSTLIAKQYTSPEQVMGEKIDARSDLYVLGVLLYEMIYGTPPFAGQDVELQHLKKIPSFPEASRHPVPIFLMKIMQKCLRKDRKKRYPSAEEILEELEVADIVPGMIINERYEIIRQLGTGGMGHVYQARDRDLDEIVAMKVLKAEFSADPLVQKRFLREIKVTRMITHPHVVKVFDTGRYKGNRYISMEYIEGLSLDGWLRRNKADIRAQISILAKIMQGVQAAHNQGIIHRDLKPQNVLIDRSLNPHVLDFGIARTKDNVDATSGQVMGSPKYMSPEQIQGKDPDKRSDIYSLGVLMFYIFTGEEPFTGDEPRSIIMKHLTQPPPDMRKINPEIPEWLQKVVMKSLEKDRDQRYSSLKEVLEDIKKGYETDRAR